MVGIGMYLWMERARRWAPLPLRLIIGYGFMQHGYAKLVHGPEHFIAVLHAMGVPAPEAMGWLTILVELAGGLAVLAGAFVPLASVPMSAVLLVAIFTVHLRYGFSSIKLQAFTADGPQFGKPGIEVGLLYLACLAALVLGGSGPLSIDSWRRSRAGRPLTKRDHPATTCCAEDAALVQPALKEP